MRSASGAGRRITISEIADEAKVSIMTVSRVLNKHSGVATDTRARVEQVIAARGFVRSQAARAMKKGRSGFIDLVVIELDNVYTLEIIRGVQEALDPSGLRLVLTSTHLETGRTQQWLSRVTEGSTDGAILVLADGQAAHLEVLHRNGIPFVVVDHHGQLGAETPSVGATNWAGGRMATEHLLALGHRRIALIGGPTGLACAQGRLSGYQTALHAANVPIDPALIRPGSFHQESGYTQTIALLELPDPPTAIFTGNDTQAFGAYSALRTRGRTIPQQMSIIGFDDNLIAPNVSPPLTTIRQPLAEMGRLATSMLMRLIDGLPLDSRRVELATSLVIRESTAPPAAVSGH